MIKKFKQAGDITGEEEEKVIKLLEKHMKKGDARHVCAEIFSVLGIKLEEVTWGETNTPYYYNSSKTAIWAGHIKIDKSASLYK